MAKDKSETAKIEEKEVEQQAAKNVAYDKPGNEQPQPAATTAPAKVTLDKDQPATPAAGGKRFACHIPNDPAAPKLTVTAQTAGDAKDVYMQQAGIISSEHPISAQPAE